ncbi:hypothetical protein ARAM_005920 [Aspergillus rambellii]|uniref:Structural maintenance of chromosomes protein 5 n=1 Tax=Aspergillus rambellii TaxID=308745 RepID=A0A0F8WHJ2_9EURO|nr:hypothetical protein ARAM_005920 [Aspergillus rambellii]
MSSLKTVPRRRQRSEEEEESDEAASSSSPEPTPASSSKRPRLSVPEEDDSEPSDDGTLDTEGGEDSEEGGSASGPTKIANHGPAKNLPIIQNSANAVGPEGFKPGAIVRIKVTDFVTYTSAEFFPGPKLNMVIGPNGTGKSTLVCAICLGLGWGPQHLGRAKDLGEFVKHGCREAEIEIELAKGPKHSRNPVICRTIKRDGNKSSFTINGKQASRADVLNLARSFSIQVDNLCQFLPQDKVSEFAALTPVELLSSTQRAASGPEMVEWHENLKSLRAAQKKLQLSHEGDRDLLSNLENRQEMQRADVERMRQRVQIKRKIEMLEMCRPLVTYKEMHDRFKELKTEKDNCQRELQILEAELEPALRSMKKKQDYVLQLDEVTKHKQRGIEHANQTASRFGKKIEEFEDSTKSLESQIEDEKKRALGYRQEGSKIQQAINKLKRQLNEEPVEFDADWYNEQIREKRKMIREYEEKANEIKANRQSLLEELNEKNDRLKQAEQQLKGLDSQAGQQEKKLQSASSDSYRAYKWLLQNQHRFEKEVFGPPIVTCSIKDPKYADPVESLLQRTDFMAFTTQTRNDFRTLQRALNGELKLHDISIRTSSIPLVNFNPPVSDDELKRLGFEGWAKDFLQGPEPVIASLCSENRMHQTPIRLQDISDEVYATMESGPISSWVAGKQAYQVIRRREYGPGATSTRVRQVRPAKVWTSQPVDASAKGELEHMVQTLRDAKAAVEEKIESERSRLHQMGEEYKGCEQERRELEQQKADKQTAFTRFRAIPELLHQQEAKKKSNQSFFDAVKTRVIEIRSQQDQLSIKKAEATLEYADAVETLRVLQEELIKLSLQKIEGLSDYETLRTRSTEHRNKLSAKEDEVKQKNQDVKKMTETIKEVRKDTQKVLRIATQQEDLKELMQSVGSHSMEQLEVDIESEKARLELTHGGGSHLIQEFEERERQIEKIHAKLAEFETQLEDYSHAINEIRGKWEPELDAIVQSLSDAFSDSFARIGCAGQVSLDKPGDESGADGECAGNDFDQWSIQIHVKFREHENLSLLDSHRQSGGERAVSTIFYLMALQSLSASPFRVVDEINQGMDPRNERMVHGRLVDIACAPGRDGSNGGGQYFLITPKLLNGLVYKPGMRVLCIVSGEHMPDDYNSINFGGA